MSRPKSKVATVVVRGPLAPFANAYEAELHELGYTQLGIVKQLRQVARLSRWLEQAGVGAADLTDGVLERFIAVRPGLGTSSAPGLVALLVVLRRAGVAGETRQHVSDSADDEGLLVSFRRHLLAERGIGTSTADRYVEYARRFLAERSGAAELSALTSAEITHCVQREAARVAVASTQYFVAGLRALLRFCFIEDLVESDLSAATLAVTGRRRSSLPKGISPAEAAALLDSCDRRRLVGRRDYAILLVLLRLGLRAAEAAGLTLDDIDWRAGQIVVHGKAHRQDRLPLPSKVGEAIAAYLQRGRPRSAHRVVFLRAVAPIGPLDRGGVSSLVRRACHRAGIAEVGAHRLRHTLACDLVAAGAGLPEIGNMLRHRGLSSTAIYARVGIESLRELALPWPGGESR
jgi:site-specific recombinase XerD